MDDTSPETAGATLEASFRAHASRRTFLKGAIATGAAVAGTGLLAKSAGAQAADTPTQIFSIAATAERLAVTFYTNGVNSAAALGLSASDTDELKAALIEEQIHLTFFEKAGGTALADTFSFPSGAKTFTDLTTFITTQQQLEGAFDSAFIAAGYEFAQMNRPDLTRVACMIAMIESEHRALGRDIGGLDPADNWAFAPQLLPTVGAAPKVLTDAGYLSPVAGNSYKFAPADFTSAALATVYASIMFTTPFVQS